MTHLPSESSSKPVTAGSPLKRRGMLLGTGVALAAGVAAAAASRTLQTAEPQPVAPAKRDETADGYRLSAHVKRYYETARV